MTKPALPEIRAEALELRRAGWTILDTAAAVGVSAQCVGRWSKIAKIARDSVRKERVRIDASHALYGPTCPECGNEKSLAAAMCKPCRQNQQALPGKQFSVEALAQAWRMPVIFPPLVPGTPRPVRGVLHVELDGSGERNA